METTDDHILETVALDLCPVLNLVAWDVLGIAGHVVACEGVSALSSDSSHEFVVFIRDEILGSQLRNRVNLVVFLLAKNRVLDGAIFLVTLCDIVE